eukprot:6914610-Pyramimonas_sp.AAC.1
MASSAPTAGSSGTYVTACGSPCGGTAVRGGTHTSPTSKPEASSASGPAPPPTPPGAAPVISSE